jgi:biopolymer transport protein TolR
MTTRTQKNTDWSPSRANALRAAKRKSTYVSGINAAAFAAIMLVILYLFIQWRPNTHVKGSVDMANLANAHVLPRAGREDAMIVAIARDGKIYFCAHQVESQDLPRLIAEYVAAGSERKVYVRPDARARYSDVKIVLDEINRSGVTQVAFLTEKQH